MPLRNYEVGERLWRDDRHVTYRAVRRDDGCRVILKMPLSSSPPARITAGLRRDYEISRLDSLRGVLRALHLEPHEGSFALALEDFEGVPLGDILQNPLPILTSCRIAANLCQILETVHGEGIVHKDVQPANVIVQKDTCEVRLGGFGVATFPSRENPLDRPLEGTLSYMAPEQTGRMSRGADSRSDLYALGCTLYAMTTGHPPFAGESQVQLVHSHIAVEPKPPEGVPRPLSDLMLKLLAKEPEDRYQSARGVHHDLMLLIEALEKGQEPAPFPLGSHDAPDTFRLSQKLYGREQEVQRLREAFEMAEAGGRQSVLITGGAGIGKSSLVTESWRQTADRSRFFISGKWEQFGRNLPYGGLVRAFEDAVRKMLTEQEEELSIRRARLLEALGPNAGVLANVVPQISLIIGPQAPPEELGAVESERRFHLVVRQFVATLARPGQPLVIFLDDLQWADSSSLHLVRLLLRDPELEHLLVLAAWRANEVEPTHPVAELAHDLARDGGTPHRIELSPLQPADVERLLVDTLRTSHQAVQELAGIVYSRTQGNPFFLNQFLLNLARQSLIRHEEGQWVWSAARIREEGVNEDVVQLLISRMASLEPGAQQLLRLASCLGSTFEHRTLALVAERGADEVARTLRPVLREELIVEFSPEYAATAETRSYAFLHDKVQQAAYATIPEPDRPALHARLGRLLLNHAERDTLDARLFDIVSHLNQAHALLTTPAQREELTNLNLKAAVRARQSTAYRKARECLDAGLSLLPPEPFSAPTYQLAFQLNLERARTASLLNEYEEMERRAALLLSHATSDLDRITVLEVQLSCYINGIQWTRVLEIGLQALRLLGEPLPEQPGKTHVMVSLGGLEVKLRKYPPAALRQLPEMTDPGKKAAMRVLRAISSAAYFSRPNLYPLVVFRMVSLSLSFGNCGDSAYGYIGYALAQSALLERYQRGYEIGLVALDIVEKFKALHLRGQIHLVFNIFIRHWKESLHPTVEALAEAARISVSHGDAEYWSYSLFWNGCHELFTACQLDGVRTRLDRALLSIRQQEQEKGRLLYHLRHLVDELTDEHPPLPVPDASEEELHKRWEDARDYSNLCYCRGYQSIGRYLLGDPAGCIERVAFCRAHIDCLKGQSCLPVFFFYEALSNLALGKDAGSVISAMTGWARSCPENYQHKLQLLKAETARVGRKPYEKVMRLYQAAIAGARKQGFPQDAALAQELAGRHAMKLGFEEAGRAHLTEAMALYLQWGARAVARRLVRDFPALDVFLIRGLEPEAQAADSAEALDLSAIVSAAQALSEEIVLEQLLKTLTRLMLQNAGAERAILILNGEEGPRLQSEASLDYVNVQQEQPLEGSDRLCTAIAGFVLRTGEHVVLDDAMESGDIRQDHYVLRHRVRSVLCAPLLRSGIVTGALYLENNKAAGVFTPERLRTVLILASQAAISLENARHFRKQQEQHEEILREREARHSEEMKAEALAARKDTLAGFLGIAAHDLRNALAAIQVWTRQLSGDRVGEQVDRARTLIDDACLQAHDLVRAYLDSSEAEMSGKLTLKPEQLELDQLVEDSIAGQLESLPAERRAQVTIERELQPVLIQGDEARLSQVLANLLGNALQYCPGQVRIRAVLRASNTLARLDIYDDGPGINSAQAKSLFEPFRRASTGGSGRGLGLWICKVIVEAHGGRIGIESEASGGHFWFELPVDTSH